MCSARSLTRRFSTQVSKFMHESENKDATEIRQLIEAWAAAVRRKDMQGILRHHAADILMFDVPPPFCSKGLAEYEKTWPTFFRSSPEPPKFDIRELHITTGTDVAF